MPFEAPRIVLAGLAKFELPGRDIRLCDGGFLYFGAEKYTSHDEDFGAIGSVEAFDESLGDEAPGAQLTFLPSSVAAAATLSHPSYQGSRIRFWFAQVDEATGEVVGGSEEQVADLLLDTTTLRLGRGSRALEVGMISHADRLFSIETGNVLSPNFHKSVWLGENGLDNATDAPATVAWGVAGPPRGASYGVGGGGSFGGRGFNYAT